MQYDINYFRYIHIYISETRNEVLLSEKGKIACSIIYILIQILGRICVVPADLQ
jgi:hypothetical protein